MRSEVFNLIIKFSLAIFTLALSACDSTQETPSQNAKKNAGKGNGPNQAPIVTVHGDTEYTIERGTPFEAPEISAFDPEDGDISHSIHVGGWVDVDLEGYYFISYWVEDSQGLQSHSPPLEIHVVDTTSPRLSFTNHASDTTVNGIYRVIGTCENNFEVRIEFRNAGVLKDSATVNCIMNIFEIAGRYDGLFPFDTGSGEVIVRASQTDLSGNLGEAQITINVDMEGPRLEVSRVPLRSSPYTNQPHIDFQVECEAGHVVALSGDFEVQSITAACPDSGAMTMSGDFSSGDGWKGVRFESCDSFGNCTSRSLQYCLDTYPVQLDILQPTEGGIWGPMGEFPNESNQWLAYSGIYLSWYGDDSDHPLVVRFEGSIFDGAFELFGYNNEYGRSKLILARPNECENGESRGVFGICVPYSRLTGPATLTVTVIDPAGNETRRSVNFFADFDQ